MVFKIPSFQLEYLVSDMECRLGNSFTDLNTVSSIDKEKIAYFDDASYHAYNKGSSSSGVILGINLKYQLEKAIIEDDEFFDITL